NFTIADFIRNVFSHLSLDIGIRNLINLFKILDQFLSDNNLFPCSFKTALVKFIASLELLPCSDNGANEVKEFIDKEFNYILDRSTNTFLTDILVYDRTSRGKLLYSIFF